MPDFYAVFLSDQEKDEHRRWHNQNVEFGNIWVKKEITTEKSRPRIKKPPLGPKEAKKDSKADVKMEIDLETKIKPRKNDLGRVRKF